MKRKILTAILATVCALCCLFGLASCKPENPGPSGINPPDKSKPDFVETPTTQPGLEFQLSEDGASYAVKGIGKETNKDIIIPATYTADGTTKTLPVTAILDNAFSGQTEITSVTMPDSIVSIGNSAFTSCQNLLSVKFPNDVAILGTAAFTNCTRLIKVVLNNNLTAISSGAFQGCTKLTSISIPDSVKVIESRAFHGCSALKTVDFGHGVTQIGENAFYKCTSLQNLNITGPVESIGDSAFENCESLISAVIPDSVNLIGKSVFHNCYNIANLTIPFVGNARMDIDGTLDPQSPKDMERIQQYLTTKIDDNGIELSNFGYIFGASTHAENHFNSGNVPTSLKNVTITGGGVINAFSLSSCYNIEKVFLGDGIYYIGSGIFGYDYALTTVGLGKDVKYIGTMMFGYSAEAFDIYYNGKPADWQNIVIDKGVENKENDALLNSNKYYFSQDIPEGSGSVKFWHYNKDGEIQLW